MPPNGLARARKRGVLGMRPSCRRQGAVRCATRQVGVGERDGLVIAVAHWGGGRNASDVTFPPRWPADSDKAIHGIVRGLYDQQPQQKAGCKYRKADVNHAI